MEQYKAYGKPKPYDCMHISTYIHITGYICMYITLYRLNVCYTLDSEN